MTFLQIMYDNKNIKVCVYNPCIAFTFYNSIFREKKSVETTKNSSTYPLKLTVITFKLYNYLIQKYGFFVNHTI